MRDRVRNPLLRPAPLFLIALSLSIGWGIRGNFGHEAGAMIAGALSAMAVALVSGRDDWRRRVMYFGFFGALGWGFGGSIAYMYPLAFTESGQPASTYYGYFTLFLEGGLWCGMGAAGTALAAAMPLSRLTRIFTPLCFVLAAMGLRHYIEEPLENFLVPPGADTGDETWQRHKSPLYWFDADWLQALMALMGVCAYDLYDRLRQTRGRMIDHPWMLAPFAGGGAARGVRDSGGASRRWTGGRRPQRLCRAAWRPDVRESRDGREVRSGSIADELAAVFWRLFRTSGLGLWTAGRRGGLLYSHRQVSQRRLAAVVSRAGLARRVPCDADAWQHFFDGLRRTARHASAQRRLGRRHGRVCGGRDLVLSKWRQAGRPCHVDGISARRDFVRDCADDPLRSCATRGILGVIRTASPTRGPTTNRPIGTACSNRCMVLDSVWRSPFRCRCCGGGSAAERSETNDRRWTVGFSAAFVLFGVGFLNLHKLVETWVENQSIPTMLKAPFFGSIEASPDVWFRVVWWSATAAGVILLLIHLRRRLDIVPATWIGKGQLLYVLLLWMMVIGNLMRAIPGFTNGRMVTEWVLFMNACLATLLVVALPRPALDECAWSAAPRGRRLASRGWPGYWSPRSS